MSELDDPTELTTKDIDEFFKNLENGDFDIKMVECFKCRQEHIPSYGAHLNECDGCFFSRFTEESRQQFYRSFL
jgi:flavodoxin